LTQRHDILLIFDEVITGFRVTYGGAQALYGISPDMTCLGKIIGGGLPVGAYGGRRDVMQLVAPSGPVYQAGTLSGNPLAVSAGIETLKVLKKRGVYRKLEDRARQLEEGFREAAREAGVAFTQTRVGSMLGGFFTKGPVVDYASAKLSDTTLYGRFFHGMLERGVYFAPSQFEAAFVSTAHTSTDIVHTVAHARKVLRGL
jgi:glutamate-1-semialdehyde 2,1-aminomutase